MSDKSFADKAREKIADGKADTKDVAIGTDAAEWKVEELGECTAIAKDRWVTALTIQKVEEDWQSFQYRYITKLGTLSPNRDRFVVEFADYDGKMRVEVTGRNLQRIYTLVVQHRLDWIREGMKDDHDETKGFIKKIGVTLVEEKK